MSSIPPPGATVARPAAPTAAAHALPSRWKQFYQLTKPRVVQLIVFCAFIGMLLAVPGWPSAAAWRVVLAATVGIGLVAGAAAAFYTGLLGWETEKQPMGDFVYTYFRQGERRNGGMMPIMPEMEPIPPHWAVYFAVDNCDEKAAHATALGGKALVPPTDVPGVGRFSLLQDPQGAAFAIIKLG